MKFSRLQVFLLRVQDVVVEYCLYGPGKSRHSRLGLTQAAAFICKNVLYFVMKYKSEKELGTTKKRMFFLCLETLS